MSAFQPKLAIGIGETTQESRVGGMQILRVGRSRGVGAKPMNLWPAELHQ
jgi:hypothetical protein